MRIPNELLKCVVFLCVKVQVEPNVFKMSFAGTAFLVGIIEADINFSYLVTAKHVLTKVKKAKYETLYVRLNTHEGGFKYTEIGINWLDFVDKAIDLAFIPFMPDPRVFDHIALGKEVIATNTELEKFNIGIGDDLFVTGMFSYRTGKHRSIPIMRSGMISAMADEPLYENDLPYYAYLAEMRSMAGLSGSPVFFYLDKARGNLPDGVDFVFFLFGVIRAHWNLEKDFGELAANDGVEFDFGLNKGEQLNTGIAIITPGEYVKNMLEDDMMRTSREMTIQRLNAENAPVFDSALEEEVFTEGVFQNALKKVSAKISAPAEEKKETSE